MEQAFSKFRRFTATVAVSLCLHGSPYAAVGDVGVYTSPAKTFSTAAYWIEGPDGLVLVDTQFLPKETELAVSLAEKSTGKKVVAAVVLHPNPDKFNGTAWLQSRGIDVMTSAQVKALIPAVHQIRLGWFFDEYKPDYPKDAANPRSFGSSTLKTTLAGLPLTLHVLGAGASGAHVVLQHGQAVFVGDLVNPDNHAWLELGLIDDWLGRLTDVSRLNPQKIHPGRGASAGPELLTKQAAYLKRVQQLVREESPTGELGRLTKTRLQWKIEAEYPQLGYPIFMRDGLAAIWKTEARGK